MCSPSPAHAGQNESTARLKLDTTRRKTGPLRRIFVPSFHHPLSNPRILSRPLYCKLLRGASVSKLVQFWQHVVIDILPPNLIYLMWAVLLVVNESRYRPVITTRRCEVAPQPTASR